MSRKEILIELRLVAEALIVVVTFPLVVIGWGLSAVARAMGIKT